mmetsp:Transcript_52779/g.115778  ORF Transcript_52779/g.115778 Transcript_52779/m.115778 type:complete len:627 (+) Transcript_52779:151-2031(+)
MKCWVGGLAAHVAVARNLVGSKPTIDLDGWTETFTDTKVDVAMWPLQPLQFLNHSAPGRMQSMVLVLLLLLAVVVICWLEYPGGESEYKPVATRGQRTRSKSPAPSKEAPDRVTEGKFPSSGYSQAALSGDIGRPFQESRKKFEHNSEVLRHAPHPKAAAAPAREASPTLRRERAPSPTFQAPLPMEAPVRGSSPAYSRDLPAGAIEQGLQRSANTTPLMSGADPQSPLSSVLQGSASPTSGLPETKEGKGSRYSSPTTGAPAIQRVSPREMEVERSKIYAAYPGSTQNVAAAAAAAYPGSVQDMRMMTLTDGLPLPKGALAYEGQCSHPSFQDAHPLRVEFWQDNGRWIGAWGTANRSERVEIDFPRADFISVWNPVGVRTELRGKAEPDGLIKGEVFQDGEGGGSFVLKPDAGPMILSRAQRYPAESSQQSLGVPLPSSTSNASVPSTGGFTATSARSAAAGVDQDASPLQFRTVPTMGSQRGGSPKFRPGTITLPTTTAGASAVRQASGSRSPTLTAGSKFRTAQPMGTPVSSSPQLRPGATSLPMKVGSSSVIRRESGSRSPTMRSPAMRSPMVMSPTPGIRAPMQPGQASASVGRVVQSSPSGRGGPQSMPPGISGFVVRR